MSAYDPYDYNPDAEYAADSLADRRESDADALNQAMLDSRSVLRRQACQKGEPMPEFDAGSAWTAARTLYPQTQFLCIQGEGAGDCMRAATATILQVEPSSLTNWMELPDDEWIGVMDGELAALGYVRLDFTVESAQEAFAELEPNYPVLLCGLTAAGHKHTVVGTIDGQLLYDPLGKGGLATIEEVAFIIRPDDYKRLPDGSVTLAIDALNGLALDGLDAGSACPQFVNGLPTCRSTVDCNNPTCRGTGKATREGEK